MVIEQKKIKKMKKKGTKKSKRIINFWKKKFVHLILFLKLNKDEYFQYNNNFYLS